MSENNNWLGASPDGIVQHPSDPDQPSGLLEIKKPLSVQTKVFKMPALVLHFAWK